MNGVPCGFEMAARCFLMECKFWNGLLVLINQMVYNSDMLMEVENDNIGYDKRTV